jgi:hypothetical protein
MFFEAWPALVADFRSEYGVDLEDAVHTHSWRWFAFLATGLLSAPDSRIFRRFAPRNDE